MFEVAIERDLDKRVFLAQKQATGTMATTFAICAVFAQVGGLFVVLWILFSAMNGIFTWNKLENYLVQELFQDANPAD